MYVGCLKYLILKKSKQSWANPKQVLGRVGMGKLEDIIYIVFFKG